MGYFGLGSNNKGTGFGLKVINMCYLLYACIYININYKNNNFNINYI